MRACNKRAVPITGSVRRNRRGFTLVELITVLAILAILTSIGVASAVGYIRYSRFEQNQENAVSVYQAAQTALSQKVANGSIEEWSQGIAASNGITFPAVTNADETYSELVALSYFPNGSGSELYDLLSGYFYDASVFRGSMTVVINLTVTGRGEGVAPYYSAGVVGAFYSLQNSGDGWNPSYINTSLGRGDTAPWNTLPCTQYEFRRDKSFVGFFDGTEASVIGPRGVAPVVLPMSVAPPTPVNHVVGPSVDPNADTSGYLFNMRNGETLDLTWAIFDVGPQNLRSSRHNENITITLYNVDVPDEGNNPPYEVYDSFAINASNLHQEFSSTGTNVVHETVNGIYNVTKTSFRTSITIHSQRLNRDVTLPLTITRVDGDTRRDCPAGDENFATVRDSIYYYSYSISLDYMMVRSSDGATRYADKPLNLSATIQGTADYREGDPVQPITTTRSIPETYATRDMNDPVYRRNVSHLSNTSYLTHSYLVTTGVAPRDQEDILDEYTGEPISGRCVVNTLFGDKGYDPGNLDTLKTTDLDSSGGEAVITAYRHLYNIRRINSLNYGATHYLIISDIDWYWHIDNYYASEVRVYNGTTGRSPVEGGTLHIVSFPALQELRSVDSLSSLSSEGSTICSINNVQLRAASFSSGTDNGYGLICENKGNIYNIYTNNLNLVIANVADGSSSDYTGGSNNNSSICPNNSVSFAANGSLLLDRTLNRIELPVGGLIGRNSGTIGLAGSADSVNTISMRNTIVMAGQYWKAANYKFTGGVVGVSEASTTLSGVIELRGRFAVVGGGDNVAGIFGEAKTDVGARLVVNGNPIGSTEFTLPVSSDTGRPMSCVLAGPRLVAGGIAWFQNHSMTYGTAFNLNNISYDRSTGRMSFPGRNNDYQIDVTIPADGLIITFGGDTDHSPAAAISHWEQG
ncbi:MAG: type II secretion system GspH family protein, partial [Saccharofermentans sp.]|nr:type II secretion system GspH family protein [Saccharofermentans sp.]